MYVISYVVLNIEETILNSPVKGTIYTLYNNMIQKAFRTNLTVPACLCQEINTPTPN